MVAPTLGADNEFIGTVTHDVKQAATGKKAEQVRAVICAVPATETRR